MKKLDKNIEKCLLSDNQQVVLETIMLLRTEGHYLYLNLLGKILRDTKNIEIVNVITTLFNDLNDEETKDVIINMIQDEEFLHIRKTLVSSCWQNSLDFDMYFKVFVNVVINENYETAIEALSVIDEMETGITKKDCEIGKEEIKKAIKKEDDEKISLLLEVIKIIDEKLY